MLEDIKASVERLMAVYEAARLENKSLKEEIRQMQALNEDYRKQIDELEKKIDNLKLTVNGEALNVTEIDKGDATAAYQFGNEENSNQFVLKYYENGTTLNGTSYGECFVWEINVPVKKDAPVQLTYSVQLDYPQTTPGTYGTYDRDGSSGYDGLYTNNSATLFPVDSKGEQGAPQSFYQPTVSDEVGSVTVRPAEMTIYMGGD